MRRLDRLLVAAALVLVVVVAADGLRNRFAGVTGRGPREAEPPAAQTQASATTSKATTDTVGRAEAVSEWSLPPPPAPAPVPEQVRLVPSSTTFLPRCPTRDLSLSVGPGARLTLRFAGTRCHVPPLHLQAVVRDVDARIVYRGPALASEDLSGNFAGAAVRRASLVVGCRSRPLVAEVSGAGLSAHGSIRCRGGP